MSGYKGRDDNYPDDIRMFDHVPGSPFYIDPDEWVMDASEVLAEEWETELNETLQIAEIGYSIDELHAELAEEGKDLKDPAEAWEVLLVMAYKHIQDHPDDYRPEPDCPEDW